MNQSTRRSRHITFLLGASAAGVLTMAAAPAFAADPASAKSDSQSTQLQDVVVTARKRSESLQKVPVAVTVVAGSVARQENRNDIVDLVAVIPSVEFRSQPSNKDQDILIRGLGTITTSAGAEPTISTVVDGVVLVRPGQMVSDFIDLDHIEVLKGPQGTLFGRNASAGVINVVTGQPTSAPGGYVEGSYNEGNEYRFAGVINGELIKDVLAGRLAVVTASFDGNQTNIYDHSQQNGYNTSGARAKLLYTPTNDLRVLIGYDYMYSTTKYNEGTYLSTCNTSYPLHVTTCSANLATALANEGITPSFSNKTLAFNSPNSDIDLTTGAVAQIDYNFNGFTLTSISGYRYWRNVQGGDLDSFTGLTTQTPTQEIDLGHVSVNQYSEEVRLASPKGGFLDYVVGAYYLHSPDVETYQRQTTQLATPPAANPVNSGFNHFGATTTNYSVFGEGNLNFASNFRGIAGLRLVHDDLSFSTNRISTSAVAVPGIAASFAASGSTHVNDYAARLGLQYDVNSDINTYLTYSRGYKGPAYNVFFNENPLQTAPLRPETSNAFELGLKSKLFENRVTFNVALFHDEVNNYQANEPAIVAGTIVTNLINAGKVQTQGAEIDATWRVTEPLTLTGSYAYTDTKIVSFNCPVGTPVSCNVNGQPLPFAPKNKFSIRADYKAYTGERFDLGLRTDYSYQSSQEDSIAETPDTIQPGYGIWNASIGLTDKVADWNARILVKNITNQHYYSIINEANGGIIGTVPRDFDRYFGIALHKDF